MHWNQCINILFTFSPTSQTQPEFAGGGGLLEGDGRPGPLGPLFLSLQPPRYDVFMYVLCILVELGEHDENKHTVDFLQRFPLLPKVLPVSLLGVFA